MNKRRRLLLALCAGPFAAALPARAQGPSKTWRIGYLAGRSRPASFDIDYYGAFPKGMKELGYVEGKNFVMIWRFAERNPDLLPELARDLVRARVDVIVTGGNAGVRAAKQATNTVPIVMSNTVDPVGAGLIASLERPGGNITGIANVSTGLSVAHLDLLTETIPGLSSLAVLLNPVNENYTPFLKSVYSAAQAAGVGIMRVEARTGREIDTAFIAISRKGVEAMIVVFDGLFIQQRHQIAGLALTNRVPALFAAREHVEAGGLMSYGQNFSELHRRAAAYVDKILKGSRPGEIPVEQATKFELVINMKVAKALGVSIPQSVLARADKLIQ